MADDPYFIYFGYNNQAEGWRIPVNPESIEIREAGQGKTYTIVGKGGGTDETRAGEVNVIKSPKLKEVTFSSLFPAQAYPFVLEASTLREPMQYVLDIRRWMETKHPIRFIFVGHHAAIEASNDRKEKDLNFPASIESFEWKEVAGAPGDIEYTISLKEYVFYSARRVVQVTNDAGETVPVVQPPDREDERVFPETYTLQKDDTLTSVSCKFYVDANGYPDSSRYRDIMELNGITLEETYTLQIGRVIKLPPP